MSARFSTTEVVTQWHGRGMYHFSTARQGVPVFTFTRDDGFIVVPSDFTTDLGSIPRLFTPIFPRDEFMAAYIIHDYGYSNPAVWGCKKPRAWWDECLSQGLRAMHAPRWKRAAIMWAVRTFGGWAFGEHGNKRWSKTRRSKECTGS